MKKYKLLLIFFILLLFFLFSGEFFLFGNNLSHAKEIKIEKGKNLWEISRDLKEEKAVNSALFFSLYVYLLGEEKGLKSGVYLIEPGLSISGVAKKIIKGETLKEKVTFPEGWDVKEIANLLEEKRIASKDDFLNIIKNPPPDILKEIYKIPNFRKSEKKITSLEGFLFPDTYYFEKDESPEEIVLKMVKNFIQKTFPYFSEDTNDKRSAYDVLIMASLVEKEVKDYDDKRIVAGILWKRLKYNFPLQVDATISYITEKKTTKISVQDLQIDSPYNTYKFKGLPPTPICNPGIDSIKAALYPKSSDYWYYLSTPDGKTIFSRTFEEHKKAKFKYLR